MSALTRRSRTLDQLTALVKELSATEAEMEIQRLRSHNAKLERARDVWKEKAELYRRRLIERKGTK